MIDFRIEPAGDAALRIELPARVDEEKFRDGDTVKIVFRPEDVILAKTQNLPGDRVCFSTGIVDETSFVGAYERLRIRLDPSGCAPHENNETPFYLTTETPESQSAKPIIVTRPKPESLHVKLQRADRVFVGHVGHSRNRAAAIAFEDASSTVTF